MSASLLLHDAAAIGGHVLIAEPVHSAAAVDEVTDRGAYRLATCPA